MEALFGNHIPPSEAFAVAQAGDRQRVLIMSEACVEGGDLEVPCHTLGWDLPVHIW